MPVTKICDYCKNSFTVRDAKSGQRFCTASCAKSKREEAHATLTCIHCGKSFAITRRREQTRKFCGDACKHAHQAIHGRPAAQTEPVALTCRQCGKTFFYKPAYLRGYVKRYGKNPPYCSITCSAQGRREDADARNATVCKNCGKPFLRTRRNGSGTIYREQQLCSRQCKNEWVSKAYREKNGLPQVTERIKRGYVVLRFPAADGVPVLEVLKHRHVMEQHLGRPLTNGETVHHVNGDRKNNDISNLELRIGNHGPGQRVTDLVVHAIDMLQTYPEFAERAGFRLMPIGGDEDHVSAPAPDEGCR